MDRRVGTTSIWLSERQPTGNDSDVHAGPAAPCRNGPALQASIFARVPEEKTNEQRKMPPYLSLALYDYWLPVKSADNFSLYTGKRRWKFLSAPSSPSMNTPAVQLTIRNDYFGDMPRSTSSLGLDSRCDVTTSVDRHSTGTSSATVLQPLQQAIPVLSQTAINVPE